MSTSLDLEPQASHAKNPSFRIGDTVRVTSPSLGAHRRVGEVVEVLEKGAVDGETLLKVEFAFGGMRLYLHEIEMVTPAPDPKPALDLVAHPPHYRDGTPPGIEVIDIIRAHMAAGGTWETANALKYILRHTLKDNPKQDIAKAGQYLTMWTEQQGEA